MILLPSGGLNQEELHRVLIPKEGDGMYMATMSDSTHCACILT